MCDAPSPMCQVSSHYSPSFPCHPLACCIFPCHHVHFICMLFKTCIRPSLPVLFVVRSEPNHTLTCTRCTSQFSFRERDKNVPGMGRYLSSGLGISPVDLLSNFVPFGGRLMPQRLTALTAGPLSLCNPAPLHHNPLSYLNPLHALRHWITIAWAKTARKNSSPSSRYLYKHPTPEITAEP